MTNGPNLNWIASNTSGIDDDVLRDVIVRGKYRDVILPMGVVRRLDAGLESTKRAVPNMKAARDTCCHYEPGLPPSQKLPGRRAPTPWSHNHEIDSRSRAELSLCP